MCRHVTNRLQQKCPTCEHFLSSACFSFVASDRRPSTWDFSSLRHFICSSTSVTCNIVLVTITINFTTKSSSPPSPPQSLLQSPLSILALLLSPLSSSPWSSSKLLPMYHYCHHHHHHQNHHHHRHHIKLTIIIVPIIITLFFFITRSTPLHSLQLYTTFLVSCTFVINGNVSDSLTLLIGRGSGGGGGSPLWLCQSICTVCEWGGTQTSLCDDFFYGYGSFFLFFLHFHFGTLGYMFFIPPPPPPQKRHKPVRKNQYLNIIMWNSATQWALLPGGWRLLSPQQFSPQSSVSVIPAVLLVGRCTGKQWKSWSSCNTVHNNFFFF